MTSSSHGFYPSEQHHHIFTCTSQKPFQLSLPPISSSFTRLLFHWPFFCHPYAPSLFLSPGLTLKMQNAIAGVVSFACTPLAKWVSERGNTMLLSPGDGLKRPRLLSAVWHLQLPGPCVLHTTRTRCDLRTDPSWRAAPWPVTADGGQNVETEGGGS